MDRLMEGRTSFIITHRLSTIVILIWFLSWKMEISKMGKAIMKSLWSRNIKGGFYTDLYNSQFTEDEVEEE